MRGGVLSWESIVDAVLEHGNDEEVLDALEDCVDLPVGKAGALDDGIDDFIWIGTDDGDIELTEDQVVYVDGTVVVFTDDEHRESIARELLPAEIVNNF